MDDRNGSTGLSLQSAKVPEQGSHLTTRISSLCKEVLQKLGERFRRDILER